MIGSTVRNSLLVKATNENYCGFPIGIVFAK